VPSTFLAVAKLADVYAILIAILALAIREFFLGSQARVANILDEFICIV
jgi:hypothetical protein